MQDKTFLKVQQQLQETLAKNSGEADRREASVRALANIARGLPEERRETELSRAAKGMK